MTERYETSDEMPEQPRESIIEKMRFYEQHARFNASRRAFGEAAEAIEELAASLKELRDIAEFHISAVRNMGPVQRADALLSKYLGT